MRPGLKFASGEEGSFECGSTEDSSSLDSVEIGWRQRLAAERVDAAWTSGSTQD